VKRRAISNFIRVVGDKPLTESSRDDALEFLGHWRERIVAGKVSPNAGDRDLGNMRILITEWCRHFGLEYHQNPFSGLRFNEGFDRYRPPFPVTGSRTGYWLRGRSPNSTRRLAGFYLR
jgi:hypothetical protein